MAIELTARRCKQQILKNNHASYPWVKWSPCGFPSSIGCPAITHLSALKAYFTVHRTVYLGEDPQRSSSPTPSSEQVQLDHTAHGLVQEIKFSVKTPGKPWNISRESHTEVIKANTWSLEDRYGVWLEFLHLTHQAHTTDPTPTFDHRCWNKELYILHIELRNQGQVKITTSTAQHRMISLTSVYAFWKMSS